MKKKLVIAALLGLLMTLIVSCAMAAECTNHNWTEWTVKDGVTHSRHCQNEGCYATEYEDHYGGKATCCSKALCEVCGRAYGKATGVHEWQVTSTTDRQHTLTCPGCQRIQTEYHSGGTATCGKKAECTICGTSYGSILPMHSFDYDNAVVVSEATCEKGTVYAYTCKVCGAKETGVANDQKSHHIKIETIIKPTCTRDGLDRSYCINCDYSHTFERPATGHTLFYDRIITDSTCTTPGKLREDCKDCEYFEYSEIPVNPNKHNFSDWTYVDENTHAQYCENEGCTEVKTREHSGGTATCTTGVTCKYCKQEYIKPLGHAMGNWYYKNADHDMRECSRCDHYEIMPHNYGATVYLDEEYHGKKCTICGTVNKEAHDSAVDYCGGMQNICDTCGGSYGPVNNHQLVCYIDGMNHRRHSVECELCDYAVEMHDATDFEVIDASSHHTSCSICGWYHDFDHKFVGEDMVTHTATCKDCGYTCAHTGGVALCGEKPICDNCGFRYGQAIEHSNHSYPTYYNDLYHVQTCYDCGRQWFDYHDNYSPSSGRTFCHTCAKSYTPLPMGTVHPCVGGVATCLFPAKCDICHKPYGEKVEHDYVLVETVPGTCEEPGKLVYECSMCKQRSEYDHYTEDNLIYQAFDSKEDWTNALLYHKVRCEAHDTDWRTEYHFGGTADENGVLTCAGCGADYYIGTNNAMPAYHYIPSNTNLVVKNPASDAEIGTTDGSFVYVNDALCFVIAADGNLMSGYSTEILGTIRNDMLYDTKGNMIGLLLGNELILGSPDTDYDWSAALERYYTLHPELAPAE